MRGLLFTTLLLCASSSAIVHAQETPTVSLEVAPTPAESGCPTEAALRENVARRMGRDPFAPDAARHLEVSFRQRSRGWSVRVVATERGSDARAVRDFSQRAPTCAETLPAAGLAVALAIDPDAPSASIDPPVCPVCPTCTVCAACAAPVPCATCPPPTTCPAPVPPPRPRARVLLSARAGVSLGTLGAVPVLALQARARLPWAMTFAEAGAYLSTEVTGENPFTRFSHSGLYAGGCVGSLSFDQRLAWFGCLGLQATVAHATAVEPLVSVDAGARWRPAAYAQLTGAVRVWGPLALEVSVRALVPFRAIRYSIAGDRTPTVNPWPVALDVAAGPSFIF